MYGWMAEDRRRRFAYDDERKRVFKLLRDLGVGYVRIPFSGGNDEGGANDIKLYDRNNKLLGEGYPYEGQITIYRRDEWEKTVYEKVEVETWDGRYEWRDRVVVAKRLTGDEAREAVNFLVDPIDSQYSFNGLPYIHGECRWNIEKGDYEMEDQITYG